MPEPNDKSLESWIWDAACSIRGAKDAPKYKEYILPLIFTKRLCDVFDDELNRIAQEVRSRAKAFKLAKHGKKLVRFYLTLEPANPDESVWSVIRKLSDRIGEQLTTRLRAITDENPLLKGIIDEAEERRLELKPGDLLICEGGDIGRTAMWRGELAACYYQNHLHRARLSNGAEAAPEFVLFWLWYAFEFGGVYFGRGNVTTIPNLSQSKLYELPLPIPPLPEQRKIAAVLGLVQRAIEQQERLIALTTELKKALLHKLFTEGLRGEPQKQTEIGPVPQSWEVVRIGQVCSLGTGTTPSTARPDYCRGDVPFVKTTEIVNNRITKTQTCISNQAVIDYRLKLYPPGTVLMAMYGQGKTRGQVALLEIASTTTQNAAAIQPADGIDSEFLWQYLISRYLELRGSGALGHISHLNWGYVRDFPIVKPPLSAQREIGGVLAAIDKKSALAQSRRLVLHDLFRTLLHQLMTAQIRVHDLDLSELGLEEESAIEQVPSSSEGGGNSVFSKRSSSVMEGLTST